MTKFDLEFMAFVRDKLGISYSDFVQFEEKTKSLYINEFRFIRKLKKIKKENV